MGLYALDRCSYLLSVFGINSLSPSSSRGTHTALEPQFYKEERIVRLQFLRVIAVDTALSPLVPVTCMGRKLTRPLAPGPGKRSY